MQTDTKTPSDYVKSRKAELDELERTLQQQLAWISVERNKLELFEQAASGLVSLPIPQGGENNGDFNSLHSLQKGTMKFAIVEVLKNAGMGLTANQLLPTVNEYLDTKYLRSSLSPQLSRLKEKGVVFLQGSTWYLNERYKKPVDVGSSKNTSTGLELNPNAQGRKADDPGGGT